MIFEKKIISNSNSKNKTMLWFWVTWFKIDDYLLVMTPNISTSFFFQFLFPKVPTLKLSLLSI
jgi:hypothetical protein